MSSKISPAIAFSGETCYWIFGIGTIFTAIFAGFCVFLSFWNLAVAAPDCFKSEHPNTVTPKITNNFQRVAGFSNGIPIKSGQIQSSPQGASSNKDEGHHTGHECLIAILKSLELMLVAPLPYLILSSLAAFVTDWDIAGSKAVAKIESASLPLKSPSDLLGDDLVSVASQPALGRHAENETAHRKLAEAKFLLYGIFFGILLIDFITKLTEDGPFDLQRGIIHVCGLVVLGGFILGVEALALKRERK